MFGDKFGYDMQDEIGICMSDFYAGKISLSDVEDFFELITKDERFKGQIYILCKLLMENAGVSSEYSRFPNNITVFTRQYAYLSGINNQCGNYTPQLD